jgi:hypothetical protein
MSKRHLESRELAYHIFYQSCARLAVPNITVHYRVFTHSVPQGVHHQLSPPSQLPRKWVLTLGLIPIRSPEEQACKGRTHKGPLLVDFKSHTVFITETALLWLIPTGLRLTHSNIPENSGSFVTCFSNPRKTICKTYSHFCTSAHPYVSAFHRVLISGRAFVSASSA